MMTSADAGLQQMNQIAARAWEQVEPEGGQDYDIILSSPTLARTALSSWASSFVGTRRLYEGARGEPLAAASMARVERRLARLERAVRRVDRRLEELAGESMVSTEISEVPGLELRRPIPVLLEETDAEVVARWPEPGLTGVGGSGGEAIDSLREEIAATWEDLANMDDQDLSRNARTMRQVMFNYAEASA